MHYQCISPLLLSWGGGEGWTKILILLMYDAHDGVCALAQKVHHNYKSMEVTWGFDITFDSVKTPPLPHIILGVGGHQWDSTLIGT